MPVNVTLLDHLLSLDYSKFKEETANNPQFKVIHDCIFKIAAYCDVNAGEKETFNEYPDKRTMAKAGIRQNAWIKQWLTFKKNPTTNTESASNVVDYIEHPESNFPIVSEYHKDQRARNLMHITYDKATFSTQLLAFFDQFHYPCINDKNKTA